MSLLRPSSSSRPLASCRCNHSGRVQKLQSIRPVVCCTKTTSGLVLPRGMYPLHTSILVKSAWVVDFPADTAEEATKDLVLEHNPSKNIKFMSPWFWIINYLGKDLLKIPPPDATGVIPPNTEGVIRVLFESTFDADPPPMKRTLDDRADFDLEEATTKKPRSNISQPPFMRVVPGDDPTAPVNLPEPSAPFPFNSRRIVFVDKTRFIPELDELLDNNVGCIIPLPHGTGKSTIAKMMVTWVDCGETSDIATKKACLESMAIGQVEQDYYLAHVAAPRPFCSAGQCPCLVFDFANINVSLVDAIPREINLYLCDTMKTFVGKYRKVLGQVEFTKQQLGDPVKMIRKIFEQAYIRLTNGRKIFIVVDHWDAPVLKSLTSGHESATKTTADKLAMFIDALTALNASKRRKAKLLVLGNLPRLESDTELHTTALKNISSLRSLAGAFEVTKAELRNLFSVLGHGRRMSLDAGDLGLEHRLGAFTPSNVTRDAGLVQGANFNLTLHYAASVLKLDNEHRNLSNPPFLVAISERAKSLLEQSSLRWGHKMVVAPLDDTAHKLVDFDKREEVLWRLFLYLGALKITSQVAVPDPMWILELASPFAEHQLFSQYRPISPGNETPREIQLRALFERNPIPMARALARLLSLIPIFDLYDMNEAVLQAIFSIYMNDDERKYIDSYFPQLCLFTNSKEPTHDARRQYNEEQPKSGRGRFGYLDIFICAILRLRQRRAAAIELKYLSLRGFFRAEHNTDEECDAAVNGPPGASTRTWKCLKKIEALDQLSLDELRKVEYHYYSKGRKSNKVSVGAILDDAKDQLRSYMTAISKGEAYKGDPEEPEGLLDRRRVSVVVSSKTEADEVVGVVVCGIGRRIITMVVDPIPMVVKPKPIPKVGYPTPKPPPEPKYYRYMGIPGWQNYFERNSKDYAPKPPAKQPPKPPKQPTKRS
ncbi:hypothetical protein DFH09DRAFT_1449621 [Mycena vulgaris]|nr:hypothetical protein DFH09DRAFT_1449621 [Mycena vulgaris]